MYLKNIELGESTHTLIDVKRAHPPNNSTPPKQKLHASKNVTFVHAEDSNSPILTAETTDFGSPSNISLDMHNITINSPTSISKQPTQDTTTTTTTTTTSSTAIEISPRWTGKSKSRDRNIEDYSYLMNGCFGEDDEYAEFENDENDSSLPRPPSKLPKIEKI